MNTGDAGAYQVPAGDLSGADGVRRCGRCLVGIDDDPDLLFQTDWTLCATCRQVLLPVRTRGEPPT
jgi:hypothetical protein